MRTLFCVVLAAAGAVHAQDVVDLHFYVRPPYMVQGGDGLFSGLTADPARAAFEGAGVRYRWHHTPARRQLMLIENGAGLDCGVGWYKTPEREKFGKFSIPLYRDKPTVAIARRQFKHFERSLAAIVADPAVRVVMKMGLTYGRDVVETMAKARAQVQMVTTEQVTLARMVASGRVDFMFSPQEEAEVLVADVERAGEGLKVLTFPDIREGGTRHILCSKRVSDQTIVKLNAVLARLNPSVK